MSCFSADNNNTNTNTDTTNNNSTGCLARTMTALQNVFKAMSPRSSADHGTRSSVDAHTNGHTRASSSSSSRSLGKASRRTEDRHARKEEKALRLQAEREQIEERRKLEDQLAMQEE